MPKNNIGGRKHKKRKNKTTIDNDDKAPTQFAERGQVYAIVTKKFGINKLEVNCSDDKVRKAIIPGKFRKRVWMNIGDILLVNIDAMGKHELCSIEHKYNNRDTDILKKKNLINFSDDKKANQMDFKMISDIDIIESKLPKVSEQTVYDLPPDYSDEEYYDNYENKEKNYEKEKEKDKNKKDNFVDFKNFNNKESINIDDL